MRPTRPSLPRRLAAILLLAIVPALLVAAIVVGPRGHWTVVLAATVLSILLPYVTLVVLALIPPTKRMFTSRSWLARETMAYLVFGSFWWGVVFLILPHTGGMAPWLRESPVLFAILLVAAPLVQSAGVGARWKGLGRRCLGDGE